MKIKYLTTLIFLAAFLVLGVSAADADVYVANLSANTVSVIDSRSNEVTATVDVGDKPVGVAVNPLNGMVYVANRGSASVSVIDSGKNKVVATIPVGKSPWNISVDAARQRAYVNSSGDNLITVINTENNTVIDKIMTSGEGKGATKGALNTAINPEKGELFLVNCLTTGLSVIDIKNNTVKGIIEFGRVLWEELSDRTPLGMVGVAVEPAYDTVYTSDNASNTVTAVDIDNQIVLKRIHVGEGPWGVAVNGGLNKVYVANRNDDTVSVISTIDNSVKKTIRVGSGPVDIAFKEGLAYVTNCNDNTVSVVETGSDSVVDTIVLPGVTIDSGLCPFGIAAF